MTTYSELIGKRVETFENDPNTNVTYTVTVASSDGANRYFIDGVQQKQLRLYEGSTYIFNYPSAHPFKFSTTSDGSHNSGSEYTTGVTHNSSTQVTIVVATGAPNLFYYCSSHSGMGGRANTPTQTSVQSQMWFNSSNSSFKTVTNIEAWSAGANTANSKQRPGGCGTQTAGLICGGFNAPPNGAAFDGTEEYNGIGWASGGTLNTARGNTKLVGIQTAAVYFGQGGGSSPGYAGVTEEYNGTAWTTVNPMANAVNYRSGCGVENALLATAGNYPPTNRASFNEEYDGSNWTAGTATPQRQSSQGQAGTQTAAINSFGYTNSPIPGTGGDAENAISLEYDGSNWTTGPNGNGVVPISGYAMGSGTQTDAIFAGGPPTNSCKYDGTTFTVGPALGIAQDSAAHGSTSASATWIAQGSPVPTIGSRTQEFNKGSVSITAAAWASATAMPRNHGEHIGGAGSAADGLAFGGEGPSNYNYTEEWNGSSWTAGGNYPFSGESIMGCGLTGTTTLAFGGINNSSPGVRQSVSAKYDGSAWTATNSLPTAKRAGQGFGTNTAAVACGGDTSPGTPGGLNTVEEWDGTNWAAVPNAPFLKGNMGGGAGTLTAGLVFGGYTGTATTGTTFAYDGTNWTAGGAMNTGRNQVNGWGGPAGQTAAMCGGGNDGSLSAATEGYDGTSWSTRPNLGTARQGSANGIGTSQTTGVQAGGADPSYVTTVEEFSGSTESLNVETLTQG